MNLSSKYATVVALLAMSGCASMGSNKNATDNPTAQQVQTAQDQSAESLKQAHEAQQAAADQERKAADAQKDVQKAQQQLAQAQQKARTEQQKAQQLQQHAQQVTAQATQNARQSQTQAAQGLAQANRDVANNEQRTSGIIQQVSGDSLVLQPRGESQNLTLRLTDRTDLRIDGQPSSPSALKQGQDAVVAYRVSGTQPIATVVQVVTGRPAEQQGTGTASGGTSDNGQAAPSSQGAQDGSGSSSQ